MKRFSRKMRKLNERAEQLRRIINEAPGRMAEMQESITSATDKLQMVRADLVASADALRGRTDSDAAGMMKEISEVGELLEGSGFELQGVDWDMGSAQRARIHIARVGETQLRTLRSLLARNDREPAARTVLTALIQAQEAAGAVELADLLWTKVTVNLGPVPTVRIGWRTLEELEEDEAQEEAEAPVKSSAPPPLPGSVGSAAAAPQATSHSGYAPGSFFTPRSLTVSSRTSTDGKPVPGVPVVAPIAQTIQAGQREITAGAAVGGSDAEAPKDPMSLDRFKKMPKLGRS